MTASIFWKNKAEWFWISTYDNPDSGIVKTLYDMGFTGLVLHRVVKNSTFYSNKATFQ